MPLRRMLQDCLNSGRQLCAGNMTSSYRLGLPGRNMRAHFLSSGSLAAYDGIGTCQGSRH